ncbi:hypothetical protein ALC53_03844 [Atta colombica]|uniref:Reverse transcriptase domain-containing protein n=1 Tax=Atta colombica TaxID=520822 RepID=A0A195BLU0_9HYME|nr:hypothetical protein ALC53_03844 [Atta colombica]
MFSLNQPNNPRAIAFADDLIINAKPVSIITFICDRNVKKNYKSFMIENSKKNNSMKNIPHKNIVKYLGINLDERLHTYRHPIKKVRLSWRK